MSLEAIAQKDEARASILHIKIVQELNNRCPKSKGGIISFKDVKRTLSWMWHLDKDTAWGLMKELEGVGLLRIIPYHGVILQGGDDAEV